MYGEPGLLTGDVGDYFIHVHVRRGSRSSLEAVDRELVGVLPRCNCVSSCRDRARDVCVERRQAGVGLGRSALDRGEGSDDLGGDGASADLEVLQRALSAGPPKGVRRYADLAHGVALGALVAAHLATVRPWGGATCGRL